MTRTPRVIGIAPEIHSVYNSGLAAGANDGVLWAGRGGNVVARAGVVATAGPVRVIVLPEVAYAANRAFPIRAGGDSTRSAFASPWHYGRYSADLPSRFGGAPLTLVSPGQSSVTVTTGPVAWGAATENEWWGPGIENALVLSNNAQGIPRLFLRTSRPWHSRVGDVEGRWESGVLTESPYFDSRADDDYRSFAGMLVTLRPRAVPSLEVGVEHTVVAPIRTRGGFASHAFDPFTRWYAPRDSAPNDSDAALPLFGVFARWLFPDAGIEVYGEWTRADFPHSMRDFALAPQNTQAYTIGLGRATRIARGRSIVARVEMTDLAQSRVFVDRPSPVDYYTSPFAVQGYTQRGQLLGAAAGPGGSAEWLEVDYVAPTWRSGVFARRTRWDNDALYRQELASALRHDVTIAGGLHAAADVGPVSLRAALSLSDRLNYLFQNGTLNLDAVRTVDLHNVQLSLDIAPRRRER